jgi:hypothetical protein
LDNRLSGRHLLKGKATRRGKVVSGCNQSRNFGSSSCRYGLILSVDSIYMRKGGEWEGAGGVVVKGCGGDDLARTEKRMLSSARAPWSTAVMNYCENGQGGGGGRGEMRIGKL